MLGSGLTAEPGAFLAPWAEGRDLNRFYYGRVSVAFSCLTQDVGFRGLGRGQK